MSRDSFSKIMMMLPPVDRIAAMMEFACMGLRSKNEIVRYIAHLLFDALDDGDPARFLTDCGIIGIGRAGNTKDILDRRQRDVCIWMMSLAPPYEGLTPMQAARAMIKSFGTYQTRRWPRDRDNGVILNSGSDALWNWLLRRGLRMPKTDWHIAQIIENKGQI